MTEPSMTVDAAAARLGVCRRTIYHYLRDGRLFAISSAYGGRRVTIDSVNRLQMPTMGRKANGQFAKEEKP